MNDTPILTEDQLTEYRKSPAWAAALAWVKQQIEGMSSADIDTYQPYSSGYASAVYEIGEDIIDPELGKCRS